jgi:channel protein (hemolysin III family)
METPNIPWLGLSDPVAALTHLLSAALAGGAIVRLWTRSTGMPWRRVSLMVFGLSTLVLFLASGGYHAVFEPLKSHLRRLDHAAIYIMIAGTFTPVVAHTTTGRRRPWVLAAVWTFAACGVVLKLCFFGAVAEWVDTLLYLAMGWFGVVPAISIVRARMFGVSLWLAFGAVAYTFGALCELFHWPVIVAGIFGPHEVFHIAVMGGSASFFMLMLRHVVPWRAVGGPRRAPEGANEPCS